MAIWYGLPLEINAMILEYILSDRTISKTCLLLSCLACPAPDKRSDFLSLQLVSKKFIDVHEASRILFKHGKLSVHHAMDLNSITTSSFPCQRIRHLELPEDCDPVRSKMAFSIRNLKNTFPSLRSIAIRTSYSLFYCMEKSDPLYPLAYEARRKFKGTRRHFDLAQYTTRGEPFRDELIVARKPEFLILQPPNGLTNSFNPFTHPSVHGLLDLLIGQNMLAASLDYYTVTGPHTGINPYLTAWHVRLIHDAHLDRSQSVKVIMRVPLKYGMFRRGINRGVVHTIQHATINSSDMILRFTLENMNVRMHQVLDQDWFDSRFRNARIAGSDQHLQMQPVVEKQGSESACVTDSSEQEGCEQMGIQGEARHATVRSRCVSNDLGII